MDLKSVYSQSPQTVEEDFSEREKHLSHEYRKPHGEMLLWKGGISMDEHKKANRPDPDTEAYTGPETEHALSAIVNQQKSRVTKHPHKVEEAPLPPGAQDIRGWKK